MIRNRLVFQLFWIAIANLLSSQSVIAQDSPRKRFDEIMTFYRDKPDSALLCLKPFFEHSVDTVKAAALNLAGNCYYFQSKYDSAIGFFERSLSFYPKENFETSVSKNYNNLGVCHFFLGNYQKAFDFHYKARQIREKLDDPQLSSTYNNLGLVMHELGNTKSALEYYQLSLAAKIRFSQFNNLSTTLTNIANCYRTIGKLDSAIYYEMINLRHLDSMPDQRNLADCLNNLGNHYLTKKEYKKTIEFTSVALQLEKQLDLDFGIINSCNSLSKAYLGIGKLGLASLYLDSVFLLVQQPETFRNIIEYYLHRAEVDSALGKYGDAFLAMKKYQVLSYHFQQEDRNKAVLDLEEKYQTELREREIKQLKQENLIQELKVEQSKQLQLTLGIISLLLTLGVAFVFKQYRFKKRTAEILSTQKQQLEELNEFKNKLFAIISHDLRNPVHAFHQLSTSIKENWKYASAEELEEFIQSLADSSEELKMLLNNLLKWSMLRIDRLPVNQELFDLNALIEELKLELRYLIEERKTDLYSEVTLDFLIYTDRGMLHIILRNLISNALKFIQQGKKVWVRAEVKGKEWAIHVVDEGSGLSEEDISLLMSSNEDTKKIGSSYGKGAGIGLLLSKDLLAKIHGRLEITSTLGQGSVFSIIFPMNE